MLSSIGVAAMQAASSVVPKATFGVPTLIGSSNYSAPGGTRFWFPSISVATGIKGHVAQHVTLADDGGWGPAGPEGPCGTPSHPETACEQIMLTQDGGLSYSLIKTIARGTSGNFNGYGDLGTFVPPPLPVSSANSPPSPPGQFRTLVGCNDCGDAVTRPILLQTWEDASNGTLRVVGNTTVTIRNVPDAFNSSHECAGGRRCGLGTPSQTIVATADGALLAAFYGNALGQPFYSIALFKSVDGGLSWTYLSRVDATPSMPDNKGVAEPTMAVLSDGRVLLVFRLRSAVPLWKAYSSNHGATWSSPEAMVPVNRSGSTHEPSAMYAVWPQLLKLSTGALVLASGRPGIGFWIASQPSNGTGWIGYDVEVMHSRNRPDDPFDADSGTTSYTGISEVEPGVVLLAYDKVGADRHGDIQKVYSVRITIAE